MYALIDVNSFYANCEKIFRPDLANKPVIVLSNNDACVIARSNEAKAIGIKMAQPLYQIPKSFLQQHDVAIFSSNYAFYADMSARVMDTIESILPHTEIYSIDEAFSYIKTLQHISTYDELAKNLKHTILKNTHLPVSVGIGSTKTLAKLANNAAKKWKKTQGIVILNDKSQLKKLLAITPVNEVWGIGHANVKKLNDMNIFTALDLSYFDDAKAKFYFGITMQRIVKELNEQSCLLPNEIANDRQQIVCSRSIGSKIADIYALRSALSQYVARASEKLRENQNLTKMITVFIKTDPFCHIKAKYTNSISQKITATNETNILLNHANHLLDKIWNKNYQYSKVGVIYSDFCKEHLAQSDLFENFAQQEKSSKLMNIIDTINKDKSSRIGYASELLSNKFGMNRNYLSPAYTTKLSDIKSVKIG